MDLPLYALDIETTGLDPREGRILSAALWGSTVRWAGLSVGVDDEELVASVQRSLARLPAGVVVGWNTSGFDVAWLLSRRLPPGRRGITARRSPERPLKYPAPDGTTEGWLVTDWAGHRHADIARAYRDWAHTHGVAWDLKSVAAALGLDPVREDRTEVGELPPDRLLSYNLSDVRVTYELAARLGPDLEQWIDDGGGAVA